KHDTYTTDLYTYPYTTLFRSQGRRINFKNTVIIMTSNCGAENIVAPKRLGFGTVENEKESYNYMKGRVMDEVKRSFKPEFLNRIDRKSTRLNSSHVSISYAVF